MSAVRIARRVSDRGLFAFIMILGIALGAVLVGAIVMLIILMVTPMPILSEVSSPVATAER